MSRKLTQEERNQIIEEMYEEFSDVLVSDEEDEEENSEGEEVESEYGPGDD